MSKSSKSSKNLRTQSLNDERWSRQLVERSTNWLDEPAVSSFKRCNMANIHDDDSTSARRNDTDKKSVM